jgi:hypothetical protein
MKGYRSNEAIVHLTPKLALHSGKRNASRPRRFIFPSIHCIGSWLCYRPCVHIQETRQISYPYGESNEDSSIVQLVAWSLHRLSYPGCTKFKRYKWQGRNKIAAQLIQAQSNILGLSSEKGKFISFYLQEVKKKFP